ncbi:RsmE family RNA methyltransferase [Candidatus Dependentiae bacterium]
MSEKQHKHEFAFYVADLTPRLLSLEVGAQLSVAAPDLSHRIARVVRMTAGGSCLLFDRESNIDFKVLSLNKKGVVGQVMAKRANRQLFPSITFFLSLLKRDHFESALYSLVELGANTIQPIITSKVQRKWGGQKEYDRSLHILSAAAEQSKHFAFPVLKEPVSFEKALAIPLGSAQKLFFDAAGNHAKEVVDLLHSEKPDELVFMVGPEGDLSEDEKLLLRKNDFTFCALTPTVLRASQAVVLSVGLFRAMLK